MKLKKPKIKIPKDRSLSMDERRQLVSDFRSQLWTLNLDLLATYTTFEAKRILDDEAAAFNQSILDHDPVLRETRAEAEQAQEERAQRAQTDRARAVRAEQQRAERELKAELRQRWILNGGTAEGFEEAYPALKNEELRRQMAENRDRLAQASEATRRRLASSF